MQLGSRAAAARSGFSTQEGGRALGWLVVGIREPATMPLVDLPFAKKPEQVGKRRAIGLVSKSAD